MKDSGRKQPKKTIEDALAEKHACYILITCDKSKEDGLMDVQLSYGGDAVLASYLLDEAKDYIDDFAEEACLEEACL